MQPVLAAQADIGRGNIKVMFKGCRDVICDTKVLSAVFDAVQQGRVPLLSVILRELPL